MDQFTPADDLSQLRHYLDQQSENIDRISVPREVRIHVEHFIPGEKLTADASSVIMEFLRDMTAGVDDVSDEAQRMYVVADRLGDHIERLETSAKEADLHAADAWQRAADLETETRGDSPPPPDSSEHLGAVDAVEKDTMEEKIKVTSPSKIELLKMAMEGITITSKKTAASENLPWVHGRVINNLVKEGFLLVLAEAAHEKEIETTEAGSAWLDHQLNALARQEEDAIDLPDPPEHDVDEPEEESDPVEAKLLEPAGRVLVFITEEDGQINADIDVRAIVDVFLKAVEHNRSHPAGDH